uniref:Arginine decarboxylase n=1 Tax=Aegilops tauschii TaxID=37682 RepID=M8AUY9_AEGTA
MPALAVDAAAPVAHAFAASCDARSTSPRWSPGPPARAPAAGSAWPCRCSCASPDVLRHRVETLNAAFAYAVRSTGYAGRYQGVYPVKCNQDRYVVEDIVEFGAPFGFGLEAGSKPELLLTMSCLVARGSPDALLVCNGYKDLEYVSLALIARTMGLNTVIVLEQEEELDIVVEASRRLNIRPVVGMRAKLRTKHAGHFGATSGEKGKFGLNAAQILSVVAKLKALAMLDCLQLLHFHIGSQIPTTALLADGVDQFIGGRSSLPLHELPAHGTRGYYLGVFLGGAYQEALGGLHNLFGGPSVVRVSQSDGPHCFAVTRAAPGPSCADVLRAMQHEPEVMFEVLKQRTTDDGATAAALARAFGSMPYLSFDAEEAAAMSGAESSGMSSDSEGSAAGAAEDDDEEWEVMRGLTV